jgi:hypothetical protein
VWIGQVGTGLSSALCCLGASLSGPVSASELPRVGCTGPPTRSADYPLGS